MKSATWNELLWRIMVATTAGEVEWTPTDITGSMIAAFDADSVTVRNVYPSTSPIVVGLVDTGHVVELRNDKGNVVASLDGRSGPFRTASALSSIGMLVPEEESRMSTMADPDLIRSISALAEAIKKQGGAGEKAARRIIDGLG